MSNSAPHLSHNVAFNSPDTSVPGKKKPLRILILGASYGSLVAIKLLAAGHHVTMTCRTSTAVLMNTEGFHVRLPIKGRKDVGDAGYVTLNSRELAGRFCAATPAQVNNLTQYDLVVLAMQEPQYAADGIRQLMLRIAAAQLPCVPIMNMPPLPYLRRLGLADKLDGMQPAYTAHEVWEAFSPNTMTLSSPDPQAFRPAQEPINMLHVGLPTNFKVAPFATAQHTELLRQLQDDIEAYRHPYVHSDGKEQLLELPVKLRLHESLFVPLAKWAMLLAGNYRCIEPDRVKPIEEAVLGDRDASESIYHWVQRLCVQLGAAQEDLVPFDKYAVAAAGLLKPSSVARALVAGALAVERVDMVVQKIAARLGMEHASLNQTVANVDAWLRKNRANHSLSG